MSIAFYHIQLLLYLIYFDSIERHFLSDFYAIKVANL